MEVVLNQILDWLVSVFGGVLDFFSKNFLGILSPDLAKFNSLFSFITSADVRSFIMTFGLLLTLILCVYGLFKGMFGKYMDTDSPIQIVAWGMGMGFLILWGDEIYNLFMGVAKPAFDWINGIQFQNQKAAVSFNFIADLTLDTILSGMTRALTSSLELCIKLVAIVYLGWQYLKLLLESVERYVLMGVLYYTAPFAYSMGTTKQTRKILQSWFRMVLSNLFLMIINVWFIRSFCYGFGNFGTVLQNGTVCNIGDFVFSVLILGSFLKIGSNFDKYLKALGVITAQTGGGLIGDMIITTKSSSLMVSSFSG